jgi:SAM-dependent methyltransferase
MSDTSPAPATDTESPLRDEVARLLDIVRRLQADNRWASAEIELLRTQLAGGQQSSAPLAAQVAVPRGVRPAAATAADVALGGPVPPPFADDGALIEALAAQQWTSHNVRLTPTIATMPEAPDFFATDARLAAIRRMLRLTFGDDLTGVRVADLGCLEGGFALALALEGATVVGLEARPANVAKAQLLRRHFQLPNLVIVEADVKDFIEANYGRFDVVLALGIAYHLDQPAAWLSQLGGMTDGVLVVESHIAPVEDEQLARMRPDIGTALSPLSSEQVGPRLYPGRWYAEFPEDIPDAQRAQQLWASWSNHRSFWLTEEAMLRAIHDAGFDVVVQQHDGTLGQFDFMRHEFSRGMFVGCKSRHFSRS